MILALKTSDEISELYLLQRHSGLDPESRNNKTAPGNWIPDQVRNDRHAVVAEKKWQAGRELGQTLLGEIEKVVAWIPGQARNDSAELRGLIVFAGPGSFTGLRIGIATMNAIAYAENIPIVGVGGENWLERGIERLEDGENDKIVAPDYGSEPKITKPKKIP